MIKSPVLLSFNDYVTWLTDMNLYGYFNDPDKMPDKYPAISIINDDVVIDGRNIICPPMTEEFIYIGDFV